MSEIPEGATHDYKSKFDGEYSYYKFEKDLAYHWRAHRDAWVLIGSQSLYASCMHQLEPIGSLSYPLDQLMPRYQLEQLRGFAQDHVKLIDGTDQELELEARDIYAFAARSDLVLDLFAERDVLLEALEDLLEAEGVLSIAVAERKARLAIAKAKGEGK